MHRFTEKSPISGTHPDMGSQSRRWKTEKKSQSLNNYKAKGIMMKDQIVHMPERKDQKNSNNDINYVLLKLNSFDFVHSIILFGSKARGTDKEKSDIDICIIQAYDIEISLKERIALDNSVPENIDISLLNELPVYIRKRVFLEGKVLCTKDMYYILTLSKINDMEYERYKRFSKEYHRNVLERVRSRLR